MINPLDHPTRSPMSFAKGDTVILCEGHDECAVLHRLCEGWKRAPRIGVCPNGQSVAEELELLAGAVQRDGNASVGLVFDAEPDRTKRVAQIRKWLVRAGFKPPGSALTVTRSSINGNDVRIAYLINPHGKKQGAIESYFVPQIRRADNWQCIEQLLDCYGDHAPTTVMRDKLIARTFIAHKNGHNTGLNSAFTKKILSCDDDALDPVRRFVSSLRSAFPVEHDGKQRKRR